MKKVFCFMFVVAFCLMNILVCLAGDIPEGLLSEDTAMVFYGEVTEVGSDNITVLVTENIKGVAEIDETYSYAEWIFTDNPVVGEVYLCGYYDDNNPLNIWEIDYDENGSVDIIASDNMSNRMEDYINNGDFAMAQNELINLNETEEGNDTIAVVGSADGPTEIFVSSNSQGIIIMIIYIVGVVLSIALIVALVLIIKSCIKKK